jgi:hypothetical protein
MGVFVMKKSYAKKAPAKKVARWGTLKEDPVANQQKESLASLRLVLEKLQTDHGKKIFTDDDKLFEACAVLEDASYSAGRDILLTLFMKKLPQQYVAAIGNDAVLKDVKKAFKTRLQGELGISPEFAQRVLNIFIKIFTK